MESSTRALCLTSGRLWREIDIGICWRSMWTAMWLRWMCTWRHRRSLGIYNRTKRGFNSFFHILLHGVTSAVIRAYLRYVQYIPICCLSLSLISWLLKIMAALTSLAHTWLPGLWLVDPPTLSTDTASLLLLLILLSQCQDNFLPSLSQTTATTERTSWAPVLTHQSNLLYDVTRHQGA